MSNRSQCISREEEFEAVMHELGWETALQDDICYARVLGRAGLLDTEALHCVGGTPSLADGGSREAERV